MSVSSTTSPDRPLRLMMAAAVACAVISTALAVRSQLFASSAPRKSTSLRGQPVQVENWDLVKSRGHRIGPADAPVVVVEFGDFLCPFCKRFELEVMPAILKQYPTEVAYVYRHWPLAARHPQAYGAARAAECAAAEGRFFELKRAMMEQRDSIGKRPVMLFANDAGIKDRKAFSACLADSTKPHPGIEADIREVKRIGGSGTPTVVVNGKRLIGTPDTSVMNAEIRAALTAKKG
jgi:protein-disulfide isomerase